MSKIFMLITFIVLAACKEEIDTDAVRRWYSCYTQFNLMPCPWDQVGHLRKVADGTRIFDGDSEPKYPVDQFSPLEGVDTDKDGLRDEVEAFINERFKTYNERMAWKSYARRAQTFMLDGGGENYRLVLKALFCANLLNGLKVDDYQMVNRRYIDAFILSTYERIDKDNFHSNAMSADGSYAKSSEETDPDKLLPLRFSVCDFDVQNTKEITKKLNKHSRIIHQQYIKNKFVF
ncbi:MAG: hypothetical protein HYV97_06965 [Bdellovibrio sp.]|nr:hypothetical protein [Bdellovibrio sp.]